MYNQCINKVPSLRLCEPKALDSCCTFMKCTRFQAYGSQTLGIWQKFSNKNAAA